MTDHWFPIIDAPKSCIYPPKVDLWVHEEGIGGYRVPDAFWHDGAWKVRKLFGFKVKAFPMQHTVTHWMRRPSPPCRPGGKSTPETKA